MTNSIYLALDFPDWEETEQFLTRYNLQGVPVKVGMELFYREGIAMIEKLKANNHSIFLDLKLHDIPTTVQRAMKNLAKLDVDIVNVHALGGSEMIKRAKEGLLAGGASQTKLLAVTILTSMNERAMQEELGLQLALDEQVEKLASLSNASGADGVVCSVHEAEGIKRLCGDDFLTVTPGIRLKTSERDDQERVATPSEARRLGADYLVMGRSITRAADPKAAYHKAIKETVIHGN
ncbi:orotidine-5'-phosphate decarboxylase [Oceanobacillus indicireducens]|uniref:Orotidine 5'-phosphate decarboxylase n=1 Tax=Oceanobacillus indicireducens TaxID=1004261 RepID=A0A917XS99_9BACI|nr:orotidine-5'-phosphate decarboxylase [Oceanobacillus indicireducens]GGN49415.1 orotidine 5'-phosphate decarboxylase [Oceanobacillus indicireducens]